MSPHFLPVINPQSEGNFFLAFCFPRPPTFALSSKKERLIAGDPVASQQTFSGVRLRGRLGILWFEFSLWVLYFAGILFADFLHRHFFVIAKNANSKTREAKYQQQGFPRRVFSSMQCGRISGGRKLLVYVRIVVLNRHLWCYDGGRLGRVKIVTLRIGARAKEGERGGGGEKKMRLPEIIVHFGKTSNAGKRSHGLVFSLLSPHPLPRSFWLAPFSPLFSSFNMALSRAKWFAHLNKTPALQARYFRDGGFE